MPFDYQMVTFEEIIKNDFLKWAQFLKNLPYFFITKSASTMADKKTKKGVVLMGTTPFLLKILFMLRRMAYTPTMKYKTSFFDISEVVFKT